MYQLKEFANILTARIGLQLGKDLFMYSAPPEKDVLTLLMSSTDGVPIDFELKGLTKSKFQAIIRHGKHEEGLALAKQVQDALTIEQDTVAGDILVKYCRPKHQARPYRRADSGMLEFSINFDVCFVSE